MTTSMLNFPLDMTEELYVALKGTASALARQIDADADAADISALQLATALLRKVEEIG